MRKKSYVIFYTKKTFLLLKKSKNGLWELPGGKKNKNETYANAAFREAFEETGYLSQIKNDSNTKYYFKETQTILFFVEVDNEFSCILSSEHQDFAWVSFAEYPRLLLNPKCKKFIESIKDKICKNCL